MEIAKGKLSIVVCWSRQPARSLFPDCSYVQHEAEGYNLEDLGKVTHGGDHREVALYYGTRGNVNRYSKRQETLGMEPRSNSNAKISRSRLRSK